MTLLNDLTAWLADNPPAAMPYWPGAALTGAFGLRTSRAVLDAGGSPLHLGVDRAGGGQFTMPFDGSVFWRPVDGVAGSVLSLNPHGLAMEIQVFHTVGDGHALEISERLHRGDPLPVTPGDLGLSLGVHTHTEVLMPYDDDLQAWLQTGSATLVIGHIINAAEVVRHCAAQGLDDEMMLSRARAQVGTWRIREMTDRYAVREGVPEYRTPEWGSGPTIHVDSQWLLSI